MSVRTRFAPSPTGPIHIGNIRAAIFNWLAARHAGGQFLLRVEDTDRERSTPEAVRILHEEMAWLGLEPDEEPLYQTQRLDAHLAAAEDLLARDLAYRSDFGKPEQGECVVFRMPGKDLAFEDAVKGSLSKGADDMKDLVIVRSNGSPVFHLANVVDDIHMGVNLVMRGDDHVENTFRHVALYEALGAELPRFAHLPMIVNAQGKPYAKRDGDAFIGDFRDKGYLPDTMFNFLTLLGWNPGDDREVMPRDELVEAFSLDRVQSSPAQVDLKKLAWMNGEYLRRETPEALTAHCREAVEAAGLSLDGIDDDYFQAAVALMGERLKFYADMATSGAFFFTDDFAFDEKAVRKRLQKDGVREQLEAVASAIDAQEPFDADGAQAALDAAAATLGIDPPKFMAPLRLALSGQGGGPSLVDVMALLGKERCVQRIRAAIERFFE